MLTFCSFLHRTAEYVKQIRRGKALAWLFCLLAAAGMVCADGSSLMTAFAETAAPAWSEEKKSEEASLPEADLQIYGLDLDGQGQKIVGQSLTQKVREEEAGRRAAKAAVEKVKRQIRLEAAEKQKEEEEKARLASAAVPCSQEDYDILLRIVQAEAGICDSKGKILVANVILNRVRSSAFPDTIKEVVYQRSQFSPVSNGTINTCRVTSETVECVNRALAGEDYSQGALYFMNRGASRSGAIRWFDGRLTYLFQHGSHEFFK